MKCYNEKCLNEATEGYAVCAEHLRQHREKQKKDGIPIPKLEPKEYVFNYDIGEERSHDAVDDMRKHSFGYRVIAGREEEIY